MKHYTAKTTIQGYKLKSTLRGLTLVGIPYMPNANTSIMVNHGGIKMLVNTNSQLLHKELFKDRFVANRFYTLFYFEWLPNNTQITLFP